MGIPGNYWILSENFREFQKFPILVKCLFRTLKARHHEQRLSGGLSAPWADCNFAAPKRSWDAWCLPFHPYFCCYHPHFCHRSWLLPRAVRPFHLLATPLIMKTHFPPFWIQITNYLTLDHYNYWSFWQFWCCLLFQWYNTATDTWFPIWLSIYRVLWNLMIYLPVSN